MKTLIIKAHPSTQGFTHTIADTYKESREGKGGEVHIIDLYRDTEYQQPFLTFENVREEWSGQEARERVQEKIMWADELVFVYPVWWAAMPAIMKNFLDNNFTNNFAYKFNVQTRRLEGLLSEKQIRIFTTGDAPRIAYMVLHPLMRLLFKKSFVDFCGMKLVSFDIFSNMVGCKEDCKRDAMLEKVQSRA